MSGVLKDLLKLFEDLNKNINHRKDQCIIKKIELVKNGINYQQSINYSWWLATQQKKVFSSNWIIISWSIQGSKNKKVFKTTYCRWNLCCRICLHHQQQPTTTIWACFLYHTRGLCQSSESINSCQAAVSLGGCPFEIPMKKVRKLRD